MDSWELEKITEILAVRTCNMEDKFIFGLGYDDTLAEDEICVTVIASHLKGTLPETPIKKHSLNHDTEGYTVKTEEDAVEKQTSPPVTEQKEKPNIFSSLKGTEYIDNETLRQMKGSELDKHLETPRYQQRRDTFQENGQGYAKETSSYQAGMNGQMNCQPAYFKSVVD